MKTSQPPIIVSQNFKQTNNAVWKAITDVKQMRKWFFENIPDFKAEVGFKTSFNVKAPSQDFMHLWEIIEVIPYKKIVYDWSYQNLKGRGKVIFELSEYKNTTDLTLTNVIVEDFPDGVPEFTRKSCIGGWNYFIKERLKKYLDEA